jgi:hypothetical protein
MEKEIIKKYWEKKHIFRRNGEEIISVENTSECGATNSLANVCRVGDYVNGDKVVSIMLGMSYCYCVVTENWHTYYSWNISSIKTKKHTYNVLDTDNEVFLIPIEG